MAEYILLPLTLLFLQLSTGNPIPPDESILETVFTVRNVNTESISLFPSVGNGHVSTVVNSSTVFLSGLYSGWKGNTHRAQIPNPLQFSLKFPPSIQQNLEEHLMTLNTATALWSERWIFTNGISLEHRLFAHRKFPTLLVHQIEVVNVNLSEPFLVTLVPLTDLGNQSWIDLKPPYIRGEQNADSLPSSYFCAEVVQVETETYSEKIIPEVCSMYSNIPQNISFSGNSTVTFLSGFGVALPQVQKDWAQAGLLVAQGKHSEIIDLHVAAWQAFSGFDYTSGPIQVLDNLPLGKVINAGLYYLLCNLPSAYSLSPAGLSYGISGKDYQGHVFWDTEIWMFPPLLHFYPEVAKQLLDYRVERVQVAQDRARETGFKGARYPWESAASGMEVSPEEFFEGARSQVHISSDISFAIRQYIAMTRDLGWLKNGKACGVVRDIAEFWSSRVVYNATGGYHSIRSVMSPDEDHTNVTDNPFTNVGAGYSIFFAKYAQCLCGGQGIPEEWEDIAQSLKLLSDKERNYHPEYEGYRWGEPIKQADVVLIGYPLLYEMPVDTRKNDLRAYENATRISGPAMSWSMHAIGNLEVGWREEAEKMFNRSYQWHTEGPWNIWKEWLPERVGPLPWIPSNNFLTGIGGFLQSLLAGYASIRVHPEKLVIGRVTCPPGSKGMRLKGIAYLGNTINIEIGERGKLRLELHKKNAQFPLQVRDYKGKRYDLKDLPLQWDEGNEEGFWVEIKTSRETGCEVPYDRIGGISRKNKKMKRWRETRAEKGYGDIGCSMSKKPTTLTRDEHFE